MISYTSVSFTSLKVKQLCNHCGFYISNGVSIKSCKQSYIHYENWRRVLHTFVANNRTLQTIGAYH